MAADLVPMGIRNEWGILHTSQASTEGRARTVALADCGDLIPSSPA